MAVKLMRDNPRVLVTKFFAVAYLSDDNASFAGEDFYNLSRHVDIIVDMYYLRKEIIYYLLDESYV